MHKFTQRHPTYPRPSDLGYTGRIPSLGEAMIRPRPLAAGSVQDTRAPMTGLKRTKGPHPDENGPKRRAKLRPNLCTT